MISFKDVIPKAIETIQGLPDYGKMNEITVIRDVNGKLSFLISVIGGIEEEDKNSIKEQLKHHLKHYFSNSILWEQDKNQNDFTKEVIKEIKRLRESLNEKSDDDSECQWFILERTIAKKSWMEHNNRHTSIWSYNDAVDGKKPKVISFYSFKGGMGRTTTLAAIAYNLARDGKNVLLIDTDIEAPGLATIFLNDDSIQNGTVDYLLERQANSSFRANKTIQSYLNQFRDPEINERFPGNIFVIPAGKPDDGYLNKLSRVDCQDIRVDHIKNSMSGLLEESVSFLSSNNYKIHYVLMDARAGFHEIGGVVLSQIPHVTILFGRNDHQSWNGLKEAIKLTVTAQDEAIPIIIVDSMFYNTDSGRVNAQKQFKKDAYTYCLENYYCYKEDPPPGIDAENDAHSPVYIPYLDALNGPVTLLSDGSADQTERVSILSEVFAGKEYREILNRIYSLFDDKPESRYEKENEV